jgi:hypothetical protein
MSYLIAFAYISHGTHEVHAPPATSSGHARQWPLERSAAYQSTKRMATQAILSGCKMKG